MGEKRRHRISRSESAHPSALLARGGVLELHPLVLHFSRVFHGILCFHILGALLYLTTLLLHAL